MSIDPKTARHTCNVVRRQIQNAFPDLYIHYCIHGERKRLEAYTKDSEIIRDHPAGKYFLNYHDKETTEKVMSKNKSRFVSIARHNKPGFLGFSKSNDYMALCFINYDRFSNETNIRNHAYSVAWHAVCLYRDYARRKNKAYKNKELQFIDDQNVLIPNITKQELSLRNLEGDIFSACLQTLQKKEDIISLINKQRIYDTLTAQKGFRSEQYPFPACVDQLEAILKKLLPKFTKERNLTLSAVKMTDEIIQIYDEKIIEKWKSFSIPAQQMAWSGQTPEIILGAALYTCENTYTQSTADMVAEKMNIKPEPITAFQEHNPFAQQATNIQTHKKLTQKTIESTLPLVKTTKDYEEILKVAEKQNALLLENKSIGWCAGALLRAAEIIKHCDDEKLLPNIIEQAKDVCISEAETIHWETLDHFSYEIFRARRKGEKLNIDDLIELSQDNEEFTTINSMLYALKLALEQKTPEEPIKANPENQNIDVEPLIAKRPNG